MSWPYRCSKASCRTRIALKKKKELYSKEQRCFCGSELILDVYQKTTRKKFQCLCGGVHGSNFGDWPHRKGSLGCVHYNGPVDEEAHFMGMTMATGDSK